jgi:hypothetical protein
MEGARFVGVGSLAQSLPPCDERLQEPCCFRRHFVGDFMSARKPSHTGGVQLSSLYYLMRDFGSAAKLCDDLIRLDPVFWPAQWFGGMALEQQGRMNEANRYLQTAVEMSQRCHWPLAALSHLSGLRGEWALAESIRRELESRRT